MGPNLTPGNFKQGGSVALRVPGNADDGHVAGPFRFNADPVRGVPDRRMEEEEDPGELYQEDREVVPPGIMGEFMEQDLLEFRAGKLQDAPRGDHDHGPPHGDQGGAFELV